MGRILSKDADVDEEMAEMIASEIESLSNQLLVFEEKLKMLLIPSDPLDTRNILLEVRAGTGGEEAGLWVADLVGSLQGNKLTGQGNKLTGKIPEVIGLMQALAVLDLCENELVGSIPPIFGNLSFTGKLYLHANRLTGPIPPELGNMTKLSYLYNLRP
ncbi:hypothetical protein SSX86_030196 [Deinandra increscens subsp. villosa]|uniref:Peptide chain release factor domain-containing protein n=1 Tax=Deinandra increscens subsp. villosa TaxID=3103831 RepID=A0AAP0GJW3_9ASTR